MNDLAAKSAKGAKKGEAWPMVRLGDVCEVRAGQSPEGVNYTEDSSYTEFHQGCKAFGARVLECSGVYTKVVTKIAPSGSILMSVRAPVGAINITQREVCIGRGLAAIIVSEQVLRDYVFLYLLASKNRLNETAGAGSVFPSISKKQLDSFEIPLPSLEVQKKIVERLDEARVRCDKLKVAAERGLRAAENLRKAILAEAFE